MLMTVSKIHPDTGLNSDHKYLAMIGTTCEIDLTDIKPIVEEHTTLNLPITIIGGVEDQDQGKAIDEAEAGVGIERGYPGDRGQDRGV